MTSKVASGRLGTGTAHLFTVPYSKTVMQTPTQVPGAGSDATVAQYYGTYSGDDKMIAFNQIPAGTAATTHPQMDGSSTPGTGCTPSPRRRSS